MLLSKLKIGDRIDHYCSGQMVQGKVSKVQNNGVMSSRKTRKRIRRQIKGKI